MTRDVTGGAEAPAVDLPTNWNPSEVDDAPMTWMQREALYRLAMGRPASAHPLTIRSLRARDLIAWDGGALVLTDRGKATVVDRQIVRF